MNIIKFTRCNRCGDVVKSFVPVAIGDVVKYVVHGKSKFDFTTRVMKGVVTGFDGSSVTVKGNLKVHSQLVKAGDSLTSMEVSQSGVCKCVSY